MDRSRWLGDAGRQLIVGTLLDISSRKEMEQQLLRMAITDPLTGLSNRRAFNEALLHKPISKGLFHNIIFK